MRIVSRVPQGLTLTLSTHFLTQQQVAHMLHSNIYPPIKNEPCTTESQQKTLEKQEKKIMAYQL